MEGYLTVLGTALGEYEEKRSRFIAELRHIDSAEEAAAFIKELKSKYWDARHNVYAYVLENGECRFSDDGEPHGTAGKPVLDIINGRGLKNVCIVVTRYFGGVLLGTGGLVRAYSEAAKAALTNSEIAEMGVLNLYSIVCDYEQYNRLPLIIENMGGSVTDTEYAEQVKVKFTIDEQIGEKLNKKITDTFFGRLTAKEEGKIISAKKQKNF